MPRITLDWLQIIALLGAVQGFFLTVVLATKRANRTANRVMAVTMFAFSIYLISRVYYTLGLVPVFPHFFGVSYPLPLIFGPLIYLYALTASDRSRRLTWKDTLHFLSIAAVVAATLPIYLMTGPQKIAFNYQLQQGNVPKLLVVIDWLKYVSGISYTTATILLVRRHRATVMDSYSSIERVNLQWLVWLVGAAAVIWGVVTASAFTELFTKVPQRGDDFVILGIAVIVYGIGYKGLRQPEVFNYVTAEFPIVPAGDPVETAAPPPRYERSGLSDQEAAALRDGLLQVMERERPYQRSELTLADLSDRLDTTPHKLSEVLSQKIGQTFYDFVNGYRVEDVRRRVADAQSKNLTLLALALDAGFASKSTFNNVFKKHTGKTPSDYRRALAS